jgi:hypothetical protein
VLHQPEQEHVFPLRNRKRWGAVVAVVARKVMGTGVY